MSDDVATVRPKPRHAATVENAAVVSNRAAATAQRRRSGERNLVVLWRIAILIGLVAGMFLLNAQFGNLTMPNPLDVLDESRKMWTDGTMVRALGESLTVLSLGFLLAASTGIVGGIFLGGFRTIGRVLDPFVNAMNATPGAAFIPLIIVWFGLYT